MRRLSSVPLLLLLLLAAAVPASASAAPVRTVGTVDLDRYAGSWYQLAAITVFFNEDCRRDTTAAYTAQPDGTIRVDNRCTGDNGRVIAIEGRARVRDPRSNARLQVSFARFGDRWLYFGPANYLVIGLAPDYSWAVVTDPLRSTAFVLSRRPSLPAWMTARIRSILRANAIDPCRLTSTPVTGGSAATGPYCRP